MSAVPRGVPGETRTPPKLPTFIRKSATIRAYRARVAGGPGLAASAILAGPSEGLHLFPRVKERHMKFRFGSGITWACGPCEPALKLHLFRGAEGVRTTVTVLAC